LAHSYTELNKLVQNNILNRNEAIGYFVPKSAVTSADIKVASTEEVNAALNTHLAEIGHVLDYLKDK